MKLRHLKKLVASDPNLIIQICSNSYSGYCIRAKQGNHYQTLEGWFGRLLKFNSVEEAKQFLQLRTPIRFVYLVQSLAQDEVDPKQENVNDLHNEEELGAKIDLYHE